MTAAKGPQPRKPLAIRLLFWAGMVAVLMLVLVLVARALTPVFENDFPGNERVRRQQASLPGGRGYVVSYLESGQPGGQQIIFVHGTPGDGTAFMGYLEAVPEGFQYLSIDRPGFGQTRPRRMEPSLAIQAAAVAALIDDTAAHKPVLLGHSLGGPIVAAVAALYPEKVGGLLILAGSLDPDLEDIKFYQHLVRWPPLRWLIPRSLDHTNREIFALEGELRWLKPRLAEVTVPVLIIHGTADELVPYANVPFMRAQLKQSRRLEVISIDGQNHFLPWNAVPVVEGGLARLAAEARGQGAMMAGCTAQASVAKDQPVMPASLVC